jgi:hypothetical protein
MSNYTHFIGDITYGNAELMRTYLQQGTPVLQQLQQKQGITKVNFQTAEKVNLYFTPSTSP